MSLKHAILMAAACLALFSCQEKRKADHETRLLLGELDGYLSAQGMYVARKMDELAFMRRQIAASRDPLARYDLEMSLANAAFSFSFDTTRTHLQRARSFQQTWPLRIRLVYASCVSTSPRIKLPRISSDAPMP